MSAADTSLHTCGSVPELDEAGKAQMRVKARHAINVGAESFGDMSDEWIADRVRMLTRMDLDHEAICVASRDRVMRLSLRLRAVRKFLKGQWERIPAVPHAQPGSYDRGYQNGIADVLRGLEQTLSVNQPAPRKSDV